MTKLKGDTLLRLMHVYRRLAVIGDRLRPAEFKSILKALLRGEEIPLRTCGVCGATIVRTPTQGEGTVCGEACKRQRKRDR